MTKKYKLFSTTGKFIKHIDSLPPAYNKYELITGFVLFEHGTKQWYINGEFDRTDGPAIESNDGSKYWYKEGTLYREDGPAIEHNDGSKYWYLEGKRIFCNNNEEFKLLIDIMKLKGLL